MISNLLHPGLSAKYEPSRSAPKDASRTDRAMAELRGCSVTYARKLIATFDWHLAAHVVTAHARAGDLDDLRRRMQPLNDALDQVPSDPLTPSLAIEASAVDGREDGTLSALTADLRNPLTAREWLRDYHREAAVKARLARAVNAFHGWAQ